MIFEFIGEILFQRILVGFFGYYTLYLFFKIFNNKEGLKWLQNPAENDGDEFNKGCYIGVVGLIAFACLFVIIGYIFF